MNTLFKLSAKSKCCIVVLACLLLSTCKKHESSPVKPEPGNRTNTAEARVFINASDPRLLEITLNNSIYTFLGSKNPATKKASLSAVVVSNDQNARLSDTITFDNKGRVSAYFSANGERGQFMYNAQDSVSLVFDGKDSTSIIDLKTVTKGAIKGGLAQRTQAVVTSSNRMGRIKIVKQYTNGKEEPISDAVVFSTIYYKTNTYQSPALNLGDGFYGAIIPEDVPIKDPALVKDIIELISNTLAVLCTEVGGFKVAGQLAIGCAVITSPSGPGVGICGIFLGLNVFCNVKEKLLGLDDVLLDNVKEWVDEYYSLRSATMQITCKHPLEGDIAIEPFGVNIISDRIDPNGADAKVIYKYDLEGKWRLDSYPYGFKSMQGEMNFFKGGSVIRDASNYLGSWSTVNEIVFLNFAGQFGDVIVYAPNYTGKMLSRKLIHGTYSTVIGQISCCNETFTLKKMN